MLLALAVIKSNRVLTPVAFTHAASPIPGGVPGKGVLEKRQTLTGSKVPEDSSDFDENWTEIIVMT